MRSRTIAITLALAVLLAGGTIALIAVVTDFRAAERNIAEFCRAARAAATLDEVRRMALARRLTVGNSRTTQAYQVVSVDDSDQWPPGSTCSVHHDDERVSGAYHNPWYH